MNYDQEHLASLGELVATIVHEIRNPLASVSLGLACLRRRNLPDDARACLDVATTEAARLERMLRELLLYARPNVIRRARIDLAAIGRDSVARLRELPDPAARRIELLAPKSAFVSGDADKLWQIVTNLARNAFEAAGAEGRVRCAIEARGDRVELRVENDGPHIPPDVLPRVTDPFFTTKQSGTGLGLALVKRLVLAHGGTLAIESDAERGTRVTVVLPAA